MGPPPPLSDEEAADLALSMSPTERAVVALFARGKAWQYGTIAERIGISYAEVQAVGQKMQRARLAHISVIPYDGCRLFLNDRGEQVKFAIQMLAKIQENRTRSSGT